MKTLFTTLLAMGVLAFGTITNALTISPEDELGFAGDIECSDFLGNLSCWTGTDNTNLSVGEISTIVNFPGQLTGSPTPALDAWYKADVGDAIKDNSGAVIGVDPTVYSGTFAGVYTTVFSDSADDPANAIISFTGDVDTNIFCTACFLYVKDGEQDPAYYIFNISGWNGIDDLSLSGFWPDKGAISHISIYGYDNGDRDIPGVPIPAAAWLFGSGLIGLVGIARRKPA